ncbi:MAG TPA: squalene/phytoene synthase family protein [Pseudolabrys sp.]|nr:squalene/phytoene synthase family protein [Pseudolabrys sp.]
MQASFTHCASLVRAADHDRYLATLFAPADKRDALFALYAFNIEIARVGDVTHEPMAGEIRLQWWREALEGKRDGEAAAHPVASALREALAHHGLAPDRLIALIDAHQSDLYDEPMAVLDEFDQYAVRTQSALFDVAAEILGERAESIAELTGPAGIAYAARNVMVEFSRHAERGPFDLPVDRLHQHALENLAAARTAAESAPSAILSALLPMATVGPQLRRLKRGGDDPVQLVPLSRLHRQWLIWRAARDPRRIFA